MDTHLKTPVDHQGKTDWYHLMSMTDIDIQRAVDIDPDAAPILPYEQMRKEYKLVSPRIKS